MWLAWRMAVAVFWSTPPAVERASLWLLLLIGPNGLRHCVRLQLVSAGLGNHSIGPINGCFLLRRALGLPLRLPHYSRYVAACGLSNVLPMAYGLAVGLHSAVFVFFPPLFKGIFINNPSVPPIPVRRHWGRGRDPPARGPPVAPPQYIIQMHLSPSPVCTQENFYTCTYVLCIIIVFQYDVGFIANCGQESGYRESQHCLGKECEQVTKAQQPQPL